MEPNALKGNRRPIDHRLGRQLGNAIRSVNASAIASADGTAGLPDGGSGHADAIDSGPKRAASQANLHHYTVPLRKRCWCYCLR